MQSLCNNNISKLSALVGNTPLLEIKFKYKNEKRVLYAKAEHLNMTGSVKDRMVLHILNKGYERGLLSKDDLIVEATSGNTGISFSAIGKALGHKIAIFMPDWMSEERKNLIKSMGAEIILVSKEEGGFLGSIKQAEDLAIKTKEVFLPRQFSNTDNVDAHIQTTGPEIWWQMQFRSIIPDAFVAGVGTGGTIMGTGHYLKQMNPSIKIFPLEPENSPTLSTGHKVGKHRIQGISDEFIPPIVNLSKLDTIVSVDDGDAIIMAQKLAAELGLGVGISSGANFLGALKLQNDISNLSNIVTLFPDDNKKYLSTDLLKEEKIKSKFLSTDVELIEYNAFKRVCHTCCNPSECTENCSSSSSLLKMKLPNCPRRK